MNFNIIKPENMSIGYVYSIHDKDRNIVKIGKSIEPEKRIKNILSTSGIVDYEFYISAQLINMNSLENDIKNEYAYSNINGEWFDICFPVLKKHIRKKGIIATKGDILVYDEYKEKECESFLSALKKLIPKQYSIDPNTYWGNWIFSDEKQPPKTNYNEILAYNINHSIASVVYWDPKTEKYLCCDDAYDFPGDIHFWQPIIKPI